MTAATWKQIASELARHPNIQWQQVQGEKGETRDWLAISDICDCNMLIGLTRDGHWAIQLPDKLLEVQPQTLARELLPCLEKTPSKIMTELGVALVSRGLPISIRDSFPLAQIVYTGLALKSDYWCGLALNWLEHIAITPAIAAGLASISTTRWASQRNRHQARKTLKRYVDKQ